MYCTECTKIIDTNEGMREEFINYLININRCVISRSIIDFSLTEWTIRDLQYLLFSNYKSCFIFSFPLERPVSEPRKPSTAERFHDDPIFLQARVKSTFLSACLQIPLHIAFCLYSRVVRRYLISSVYTLSLSNILTIFHRSYILRH